MFEKPGEFAIGSGDVTIMPRGAEFKGQVGPRRLSAANAACRQESPGTACAAARRPPIACSQLELGDSRPTERLTLDAPVLTALISGEREKRRPVALAAIPAPHDAGGAGDRGSPLLRASRRRSDRHRRRLALVRDRPAGAYLAGGSTITQQLVRNVFLPKFEGMTLQSARARSVKRKLLEQFRGRRPDQPRVEGRDPRDVSERHPARPARVVRHPRRRRSVASVLRQGRQQRVARRSGDDRRRHPVAVGALAVQQRRRDAKERRNVVLQAMVDAGLHRRRTPPTAPRSEPLAGRRSARSRPKRRTSSTSSARRSTNSIRA